MTPQLKYLTTLLSAEVTIEAMEGLQDTSAYRQNVKRYGKLFQDELLKMTTRDISLVWGIDDAAMYALIEYQKKVALQLATLRPEDIGVIMELIAMYKADSVGLREKLEIKIVDSSAIPGNG